MKDEDQGSKEGVRKTGMRTYDRFEQEGGR